MITSVLTQRFWLGYQTRHAVHHQTNGIIDNEQKFPFNETVSFTYSQYKRLNWFKRQLYKIVRHPVTVLLIGFLKFFVAEHFSFIRCGKYYNGDYSHLLFHQAFFSVSVILTQYIFYTMGVFMYYLFSFSVLAFIGFTIVHNEHTYNPSYVVGNDEWTYKDSGLSGSSFILVPRMFKYFIGGLEYHHIHHMNAKIPAYNLQAYHDEVVSKSNMFDNVVTLSVTDCYNNLWLTVYDEDKKRYITFAEADAAMNKYKNM
jgi:omega-6 fatty acid desaturase (delta-12 desaturase)